MKKSTPLPITETSLCNGHPIGFSVVRPMPKAGEKLPPHSQPAISQQRLMEATGMTHAALAREVNTGRLKRTKINGKSIFLMADVDEWLNGHGKTATAGGR